MKEENKQQLIRRLSSLSLCFYLLGALFFWMSLGIVLAEYPGSETAFNRINDRLVLDWLLSSGKQDRWLAVWFLVLCLLNLALLVNLVFCLAAGLWKRIFSNGRIKQVLLFVMHLLIIGILLGHLVNMGVGFKQGWIKMTPGQAVALPDGYGLVLESVCFVPNPELLKKEKKAAHEALTQERFKIQENYVEVLLTKNNKPIGGGRVHMLAPLKIGSLRVTLRRFFVAQNHSNASVGAVLAVARNPVHEAFFLVYALMILCLLAYILAGRVSRPACLNHSKPQG
jgi:hypothetical protein